MFFHLSSMDSQVVNAANGLGQHSAAGIGSKRSNTVA
jgi:hypothetical protein